MAIKIATDPNPPALLKVTDLEGGKAYVVADDNHSRVVFGTHDVAELESGFRVYGIDTYGNVSTSDDETARFREVNVEVVIQPLGVE